MFGAQQAAAAAQSSNTKLTLFLLPLVHPTLPPCLVCLHNYHSLSLLHTARFNLSFCVGTSLHTLRMIERAHLKPLPLWSHRVDDSFCKFIRASRLRRHGRALLLLPYRRCDCSILQLKNSESRQMGPSSSHAKSLSCSKSYRCPLDVTGP